MDRTYIVTGKFNTFNTITMEFESFEGFELAADSMADAVLKARTMLRDRYPRDPFTFYVVEAPE